MDESNPLLERVKFLCIASSTLDEFFEIRVAELKQQVAFGSLQSGPDQIVPVEQLKVISASTHEPSMAATAMPAARRPHRMPLVMAAANSGNNGIKANVSRVTLPSMYQVVRGPRS